MSLSTEVISKEEVKVEVPPTRHDIHQYMLSLYCVLKIVIQVLCVRDIF